MSDRQVIGEAVAARRRLLEVSQLQLASLAGVSRGTVRNIETGAVAPIEATWSALESVLAWAPGSLERIQRGEDPVEVLPAELASMILRRIMQRANEPLSPHLGLAAIFRRIISSARPDGVVSDDIRIELTDFLDSLTSYGDYEDDEIEELQDRIDLWFEESAATARLPMKVLQRIVPGTSVRHLDFGPGTVTSVTGSGEAKKAVVEFMEPWRTRTLHLRFSPLKIVQTPHTGKVGNVPERNDQPSNPHITPSLQLNLERLGLDILELLANGQIVDYSVHRDENAPNVAIVSILMRTGSGPLTMGDRKRIAEAMIRMGDTLAESSQKPPAATGPGKAGATANAASKTPAPPRPVPPRRNPVKFNPDPWATASPAGKPKGDFEPEPPF